MPDADDAYKVEKYEGHGGSQGPMTATDDISSEEINEYVSSHTFQFRELGPQSPRYYAVPVPGAHNQFVLRTSQEYTAAGPNFATIRNRGSLTIY